MVAGRRIGRTLVAGGVGLGLLLAPVASIAQARGRAALRGRGERRRRPLLPVRRQRRLRRPALPAGPHLHPARARPGAAQRTARGRRDDHAPATQDLDRFNLDLRGLDVTGSPSTAAGQGGRAAGRRGRGVGRGVLAGAGRRAADLGAGRPAAAQAQGGQDGQLVVEYGGATDPPRPDIEGVPYGWVTTRDGAMVANEPDGAMTWYPVSDHPTDKATYCSTHGPGGQGGGRQRAAGREPTTDDGWTTWYWKAPDPQASYLSPRRSATTTSASTRRPAACRSSTRWTTP